MGTRTFYVPEELARWWRSTPSPVRPSVPAVSAVAVAALEELREKHPTPTFGALPRAPLGQRNAHRSGENMVRVAVNLPDDLHEWLQAYYGVIGRSGDWVLTEALTEYRSRVESAEPCTQGR